MVELLENEEKWTLKVPVLVPEQDGLQWPWRWVWGRGAAQACLEVEPAGAGREGVWHSGGGWTQAEEEGGAAGEEEEGVGYPRCTKSVGWWYLLPAAAGTMVRCDPELSLSDGEKGAMLPLGEQGKEYFAQDSMTTYPPGPSCGLAEGATHSLCRLS